jgi:putative intracellular protease/amidase
MKNHLSRRKLCESIIAATATTTLCQAGQTSPDNDKIYRENEISHDISHDPEKMPASHDMEKMPPAWIGNERIVFFIYPGFTALDMVGPHYMLSQLMGSKSYVVAKTLEDVTSDAGLKFKPDVDFSGCPSEPTIIFIPGGTAGTLRAIKDPEILYFLKSIGERSRYVTSVCTGSLLLGAAGLLRGYRATSHWLTRPILSKFGAVPVDQRVVIDNNRITGAGVTAGIDFGLTILSLLRDDKYAQCCQLLGEYDPEPPFNAGSPNKAPGDVVELLKPMFGNFLKEVNEVKPIDWSDAVNKKQQTNKQ